MQESPKFSQEYLDREKRVNQAIRLIKPDRVPIISIADTFVTRYSGVTEKETLYDYQKLVESWKNSTRKLDFDMAPSPIARLSGHIFDIIKPQIFSWAGHDKGDNDPFQFNEDEYLRESEFDEMLANPGDFVFRKVLPRMAKTLEPLGMFPDLYTLAGYSCVTALPAIASIPAVTNMLQKLIEAGQEQIKFQQVIGGLTRDLIGMGYPITYGAITQNAFDIVSDFLRGMKGSMLDMFRNREKLKQLADLFAPFSIGTAISMSRMNNNPRVFIPLHRGADGFMSGKQFEEFYWPYLRQLIMALVDNGLTPMVFFEGSYNSRLEYLAEFPKGKILAHMDKVDIKKYKQILGKVMCFWGNVPSTLLVTGTPEQVRDYVKELIDSFSDTGGLIIDGAVEGIPPQAKPVNVEAMVETVHDYGKY